MSVRILIGDCVERMRELPDNSVDSVVCDPPYHLVSQDKRDHRRASPSEKQREKIRSSGFMGMAWDGGDVAFQPETWADVLRVLKPGGHLVAFSGTRTYHRMAVAIEDAGFEVRDMIAWHYGSGFPKSHDISKAIDRDAGAEREVVSLNPNHRPVSGVNYEGVYAGGNTGAEQITAPATDAAREWEGWGTALKPATEPICLARKPLSEKSIAANILRWGTGGLNIDACRIQADPAEVAGVPSTPNGRGHADGHLFGVRSVVQTDALQGGEGETPDHLRDSLPGQVNGREGQSELHSRGLHRDADGLPLGEGLNALGCGQGLAANANASGISGTQAHRGAQSGSPASPSGECAPHQRGQGGQQAGEPGTDRLAEPRSGTRQDRTNDDAAHGRECAPEAASQSITNGRQGEESANRRYAERGSTNFATLPGPRGGDDLGRWPANLCHDGSDEVVAGFPETESGGIDGVRKGGPNNCMSGANQPRVYEGCRGPDSGSAARFFYCAKASAEDRGEGNNHPTVKPTPLMRWLVRLVTPKGGTVLDPFMGSGSTLIAADAEQFNAIGCELSPEYAAIAERRIRDAAGMFADISVELCDPETRAA